MSNVKEMVEEVLAVELNSDNPHELYEQSARAEALTCNILDAQVEAESRLAHAQRVVREAGTAVIKLKGTAIEKKLQWEALAAPLIENVDLVESEVKYYANLLKAVERRVSLIQSILSSIRQSMNAGIRLDRTT